MREAQMEALALENVGYATNADRDRAKVLPIFSTFWILRHYQSTAYADEYSGTNIG